MYERFLQLLKKTGEKPVDVAKATGIYPSLFTEWKNGKCKPKADKLLLIARHFGVNVEYFLN